jgi:hypothetical protein
MDKHPGKRGFLTGKQKYWYTQCCLYMLRSHVEEQHRQRTLNRKRERNGCGLNGSITLILSWMFDFSRYASLSICLLQILKHLIMMMNIMQNTAQPFTLHFAMYREFEISYIFIVSYKYALYYIFLKTSSNFTFCFMG